MLNKNRNKDLLFRGIGTYSGKLVEGDLIHGVGDKSGRMFILPIVTNLAYFEFCDPIDGVEILPDSVTQFIGFFDVNGTKIYGGDILKGKWGYCGVVEIEKTINFKYEYSDMEVIGNIFDGKEYILSDGVIFRPEDTEKRFLLYRTFDSQPLLTVSDSDTADIIVERLKPWNVEIIPLDVEHFHINISDYSIEMLAKKYHYISPVSGIDYE